MKIVFCINSLVKGGAERVITNLANYFIKDHDITIITLTNYEIGYEINKDVKIIKLDKKEKNSYKDKNKFYKKLVKIPRTLIRIRRMKKEIDKINPDIIISFLPESSFVVLCNKYKYKNNNKVIVSVRNDPSVEYASKIYNFIMKKLYPKADGFIFQTEDAKKYFDNIIDSDSEVILNPINPAFICDKYEGVRDKEIVSVGRFSKQKNFNLLIDSFSLLDNRFKEYKLIIYGDGELREVLEQRVSELNLVDRVLLPGVIENIEEKIHKSSLFILPSYYEGMPNALIEAMALGLPVIATDCPCGGPRMLINDKNGRLVEVDNKEEMVKNIEHILSDKNLARNLGDEAKKIIDIVAPEIVNNKWEDFIIKVVKK